jgi:hypothetical protein
MGTESDAATRPVGLRFDVAGATGLAPPLEIAGWLFVPARVDPDCTPLLTCLHGGGYDKRYYHLEVPGHPGYSMGGYLAARGCVVLAIDCLTVGESSRIPSGMDAPEGAFAAAHDAVVRQVVERLREGLLHPGLPPSERVLSVGIGHSLGGALVTIQQALCHSFDRVAILGATAFDREWGAEFALTPEGDGLALDRHGLRHHFYWDDVPLEVIEADEAAAVPMSVNAVAWAASAVNQARAVDVPLFLAFGERDVSEHPHNEPAGYPSSRDVTLFLLPRSGHCHNFAGTRHLLWDRLATWIGT